MLISAASRVGAQEEPDLSALTFTPGPVSGDVVLGGPSRDDFAVADASADPGDRGRLRESVERLTQTISAEEAANGSWSNDLIAPLTALAATYRELGEDLLAIGTLERAKQVIRRNDGLHSLDQADVVLQMIESAEAAGQLDESAYLQNALLELAMRNESDARAPSVFAAVADKQMDAVGEYVDTGRWRGVRESPPQAESTGWKPLTPKVGRQLSASKLGGVLNDYDAAIAAALADDAYVIPDSLGSEAALAETSRLIDTLNDLVEEGPLPRNGEWEPELPENDREWALLALRRARRLYGLAMTTARSEENGSVEEGEYRALQRQYVATYYFELAHPELHPDSIRRPEGVNASTNAATLEVAIIDKLVQRAPPVDVASALVELGDWHLLLSRNETALEEYQKAYDFLVAKNVPDGDIAELFSPEVPAVLPAFDPATAFDPTRRYRGYIDVSIDLGKFGQTTEIDVLDSASASDAIEKRLRTHVAQSRFRPRFVEGRPARSDQFTLRYYFDY